MENRKENKTPIPQWLENAQNNSWQIEILITGGLILSLFQVPDILNGWYDDLLEGSPLNTRDVITFTGLHLFSRALLIGFVINFCLRTIWLASIGVNFTFPNDIDYTKLNYSDYFSERWQRNPNLLARILFLERLCSVSFSLAIILGVLSIGLLIALFIIYSILDPILPSQIYDSPGLGYSLFIFAILLIFGLLDRVFFSWLINKERASKYYYPVFRFLNIISLSFIFKHEWFTLISNVKRWKIHGVLLIYLLIATLISINEVGAYHNGAGYFHYSVFDKRAFKSIPTYLVHRSSRYYNKLKPGQRVYSSCISNDIIDGRFFWLFVIYNYDFDRSFRALSQKYNVITNKNHDLGSGQAMIQNDSLYLKMLNDVYKVRIDSNELEDLVWYEHRLPNSGELGYITYIDTDSLSFGKHIMQVSMMNYNEKGERRGRWGRNIIRFWKE